MSSRTRPLPRFSRTPPSTWISAITEGTTEWAILENATAPAVGHLLFFGVLLVLYISILKKVVFTTFLTHWNKWYSVYLSSHYRFDKRTVSKYILKRRTAWNSANLVGISRWFYGFLCLYSNSPSMKAFFHSAFMIQDYLAWSMLDMSGTNALLWLTVTNPI